MNQWLTKTDLLREFNINRDVLADMVWRGKLKAYKWGDPSTIIDIPRKPKEQETVEANNLSEFPIYCFRHLGNTSLLCDKELGECPFGENDIYEEGCRWQWDEYMFKAIPKMDTILVSKIKDVDSPHMHRYEALKSLLPVLRFKRDEVEAFLRSQCLPSQTTAPQTSVVRLTPSQEDKRKAILIANNYIGECKDIPSIKEAVNIVKHKHTAKRYKDDTIRDWIKSQFPPESRKPGRRPIKT